MALPNTIYLVTTQNTKLEERVSSLKKLLNLKKLTVKVVDNSTQPHQWNHLVDFTAELTANYHINTKEAIYCSNRKTSKFVKAKLFMLVQTVKTQF